MWRKLLFLPPIILAVLVAVWATGQRQPPVTEERVEDAANVRVIVARESEIVPRVSGFGSVEPGRTWKAVAQASGEIAYVNPQLKRGAILDEGTEIFRISPADYEIAVARAQANISRVEAQLAEMDANEANLRANLEIEQRALDIRERESDRRRRLAETGTVSANTLDQDQRESLAQQKRVQEIENTLSLLPSQRKALQEQKRLNELELRQAQLNLDRTTITLPFDARISEVSAEVSQFAQAGSTLATADSIATSEVEAQIPITEFAKLARAAALSEAESTPMTTTDIRQILERLGFSATIRLEADSISVTWPAEVSRLSDTIDLKTRTVGVIVSADNTWRTASAGRRPPLTKGLFVEVELRARPLEGQIVIPRSALHDGKVYLVGENDRLEIVPVETGLSQDGVVVVREGIEPGDRVVVTDLLPAMEGMLLRATRDEALETSLAKQGVVEEAGSNL